MFQLPEIHGAAGGLANIKGWAKNWGVWGKNGGVWAKIEKVGKECMFVGKGVISLGKENLMIVAVTVAQFEAQWPPPPAGRQRGAARWQTPGRVGPGLGPDSLGH